MHIWAVQLHCIRWWEIELGYLSFQIIHATVHEKETCSIIATAYNFKCVNGLPKYKKKSKREANSRSHIMKHILSSISGRTYLIQKWGPIMNGAGNEFVKVCLSHHNRYKEKKPSNILLEFHNPFSWPMSLFHYFSCSLCSNSILQLYRSTFSCLLDLGVFLWMLPLLSLLIVFSSSVFVPLCLLHSPVVEWAW